jgi:hypothetical protein
VLIGMLRRQEQHADQTRPTAWYCRGGAGWIGYVGRQAVWEDVSPGPVIAQLIERGYNRDEIERHYTRIVRIY